MFFGDFLLVFSDIKGDVLRFVFFQVICSHPGDDSIIVPGLSSKRKWCFGVVFESQQVLNKTLP